MPTIDGLTIDQVIGGFEFLDDWEQRFSYLLDLGKKLPAFPEDQKTEANKVHGCQSQVWLIAEKADGGAIEFQAISDAHIVNGLIALLMTMYNGKTADEMLAVDAEAILKQLDLEEHLSPTRRNGLHSMLKRIRAEASKEG